MLRHAGQDGGHDPLQFAAGAGGLVEVAGRDGGGAVGVVEVGTAIEGVMGVGVMGVMGMLHVLRVLRGLTNAAVHLVQDGFED